MRRNCATKKPQGPAKFVEQRRLLMTMTFAPGGGRPGLQTFGPSRRALVLNARALLAGTRSMGNPEVERKRKADSWRREAAIPLRMTTVECFSQTDIASH